MDNAIIILFGSVIIIGIALIVIITVTKKSPRLLNTEEYQKQWLKIEQSAGSDNSTMQFAILQADKLLDKALRERGFKGQTMGERMKSAKGSFSNVNNAWAAHKLRNRIAHEDTIVVGPNLTLQALSSFKRALRDLGAL